MKYLKILVGLSICFLLFCSKGKVYDYDEAVSNEMIVGETEEVDKESPTSYDPPAIKGESWDGEFFAPIRERILCCSVENGFRIYWPIEGDTLANITWALHGQNSNIFRIMKIVDDNNHVEDPNLLRLNKPLRIEVEE